MTRTLLDATGLRCPLPVLKARKALKAMAVGDTLEIRATDPGATRDFEAFCKTAGHQLVSAGGEGEVLVFEIRKAGA